ncbi:ATP-binding protein [Nonomuraea maheshkhaliensis]|uniref:ATP-binding protein n=1 Tax=Nonomuraea maheshkhaliensis TaxID=419590 RepID=A0ABN2HV51_9ACTN
MGDLRLLHLTYAGVGKPDASVAFDPALTVIYGASDSGKSFIAESIQYMLGGGKLDLVAEADGYSQILLGLRLPDGGALTLLRALEGNSIRIYREDVRTLVTRPPDAEVKAAHTARSKHSLSLLLLAELGLSELRVRKNDAGGTRGLALSDLVHLSVVPETRMVAPLSPVLHSSAASGKTSAAAVMRLMLTGDGDPDIDTGLNAGQRRVNKGKITLLDQIILDLHAKLSTHESPTELRARHARVQASLDEHSYALQAITARHGSAVSARIAAAGELSEVEGRLAEVGDLVSRFVLLEAQYRSDLDRLDMVTEAGSILGYFRVGTCVFCGAAPEHQNSGHREQESTQLHLAVQNEAAKTSALLADLLPTIEDLRAQFDELSARRSVLIEEMARIDEELTAADQIMAPTRQRMDESLQARSAIERALDIHQRIDELEERRSTLYGQSARASTLPTPYIPNRVLSAFDDTLRRMLQAWRVPAVEYAEYDQHAMDVRAGKRYRANRGKGVRSVLHSAFTLALAQYCRANGKPHLGFVVLDSPVVTYRGPISDSADPADRDVHMTSDVVDHFYRFLADYPGQAVIIENGDPPAEVISRARTYRFVGAGSGRPGFFPSPAAVRRTSPPTAR